MRHSLIVFSILTLASSASAGELDRIERSHRPPASSSSSNSSSSTSSSSKSSSRSRGSDRDGLSLCVIPGPWIGYCLYGTSWLQVDRDDGPESVIHEKTESEDSPSERRSIARRVGELHCSSFIATKDSIWGFDLGARGWLGVGGLDVDWLRLREPGNATLDTLDLVRASTVGAFLAMRHVEGHALFGVDALHGHDWTFAGGLGLEVRIYPWRRLSVAASTRWSIFADGYPLGDSRIDVGVTLGRVDFLVGWRWLYQPYEQEPATSIFGPSASVLVRLGP